MLKDRKEYRKKYNANGKLHLGGETLTMSCYDVSVKGAMVEVTPGILLSTVEDFKALLEETNRAEIFIEDLMMSGEVNIAWARSNRNRILLGVEFYDVIPNAKKLWRKRLHYRKKQPFSADLIVEKTLLTVEGINCSLDGACLHLPTIHRAVKVDALVKLQVKEFGLNALGKVVWIKQDGESATIGLRNLTIT